MFPKNNLQNATDVPYYDITINDCNLFASCKHIANQIKSDWKIEDINCKVFKDGLTNKLVACIRKKTRRDELGSDGLCPEDVILVRIYGRGTDLLINRDQEMLSMLALQTLGCARALHGRFNNGIVYGFFPGVVLNHDHLSNFDVQRLIIKEMVKLHSLDERVFLEFSSKKVSECGDGRTPYLFQTIRKWMKNIPCDQHPMPSRWSKERLETEVDMLEGHLSSINSPIVFCHNDLLPKNIIYDSKQGQVSFIDFEYTFFNYQAFDIGNFFCEFAGMKDVDYTLYPTETFQKIWLTSFLEYYNEFHNIDRRVTELDVDILYKQVCKFSLASHIFWSLWAIIQAEHSTIDFDYLDFAQKRLDEYERRKEEYLGLSIT